MLENRRSRRNFTHNQRVISQGSGTQKVQRRTKSKSSNYKYGTHCKAMCSRRDLWRHMRRCNMKPKNEDAEGQKYVLGIASVLKFVADRTIDLGLLKMLSWMHYDGIASVARNDFYLMRHAESLYRKHGHDAIFIWWPTWKSFTGLSVSKFNLEDAVKPNNFLKVSKVSCEKLSWI